ncbi:hypothetical protein GG804_02000 [Sphingomonas histidinilytica]|uniref:hypothetical protein n=1 Tax=Sphingomonadales TaxID=204457 RepID=UPI0007702B51|nr:MULTISPECIES: hypothetical protein [Sphingomonadaceae]AMK23247.1 hypothetical protein K426_11555 [Sphingobium sp. TKS]MBO9375528.1 hypothetical protein [Rhizorhabdus histidinilytica]MCF8709077.1 hypothetical protein [Rhizorhapis sp. SPR117]
MATFKVRIVQIFRVEREVVMDVIAASEDEACELVDTGEADKPEWDAWKDHWTLEGETAQPA